MGMEIPANCTLLMAVLSSGTTRESAKPVSMHKNTHSARYFSKNPRRVSVFSPKVCSSKKEGYVCCVFCLATHVGQVADWQHSLSGIPNGHLRSFVICFLSLPVVNATNI